MSDTGIGLELFSTLVNEVANKDLENGFKETLYTYIKDEYEIDSQTLRAIYIYETGELTIVPYTDNKECRDKLFVKYTTYLKNFYRFLYNSITSIEQLNKGYGKDFVDKLKLSLIPLWVVSEQTEDILSKQKRDFENYLANLDKSSLIGNDASFVDLSRIVKANYKYAIGSTQRTDFWYFIPAILFSDNYFKSISNMFDTYIENNLNLNSKGDNLNGKEKANWN